MLFAWVLSSIPTASNQGKYLQGIANKNVKRFFQGLLMNLYHRSPTHSSLPQYQDAFTLSLQIIAGALGQRGCVTNMQLLLLTDKSKQLSKRTSSHLLEKKIMMSLLIRIVETRQEDHNAVKMASKNVQEGCECGFCQREVQTASRSNQLPGRK